MYIEYKPIFFNCQNKKVITKNTAASKVLLRKLKYLI